MLYSKGCHRLAAVKGLANTKLGETHNVNHAMKKRPSAQTCAESDCVPVDIAAEKLPFSAFNGRLQKKKRWLFTKLLQALS